MELRDVESRLGVRFPELFRAISGSGMMDYLIHSREWVRDAAAKDGNYVRQEEFFGEGMGDCCPLAFADIPEARDELYECLRLVLEINPERQALDPRYRLVPFARMISGDSYCFLYEEGAEEPKIAVYGHDTGDVDLWADNFEEFLYAQIVEAAAEWEQELHSDYMRAHVQWLSEEHKRLLRERPLTEIWEGLPVPQEFSVWTGV